MIDYTFEPKETLEDAVKELYSILGMLRSPEGCPWDRKQTPKGIASNVLDELYEYVDALNADSMEMESEELGDLLLNVMMLMHMHEENPAFNITAAINSTCEKLVRRHPHVFKTNSDLSAEQVLVQWDKIKKTEKGKESSSEDFFNRVPSSLPPLERAKEVSKKAAKVGFDWPDKQGVIDKICEELDEVIEADTALDRVQSEVESEVGDLLFAVINYARKMHVDPSIALHVANSKFERRFNEVYKKAQKENLPMDSDHVKEMNDLWDKVKEEEPEQPGHLKPTCW